MAGIFAEVLGLEGVGATTTSSLSAAIRCWRRRSSRECGRVFGVELPVRAVFEASTVAGLAAWIERELRRRKRDRSRSVARPIARCRRSSALPPPSGGCGSSISSSPAARSTTSRRRSGSEATLDRGGARRRASRDRPPARGAAHDFPGGVGRTGAGGRTPSGIALPVIDLDVAAGGGAALRGGTGAGAGGSAAFRSRSGSRRCGSGCWPLPAQEHVALVNLHHIAGDGWSMGVLTRELGILYSPDPARDSRARCRSSKSSTRTTPSGSAGSCRGELLESSLPGGAGSSTVRRRRWSCPRTTRGRRTGGARSDSRDLRLPSSGLAGLAALSRQHRVTLFMTLLAGFAALLQRVTGQDDTGGGHADRGAHVGSKPSR